MRKKIIPYQNRLVKKAQELRNNSTFSERILWKYLKRKQINGFDFDRQKPIDKYIVDFYCSELMLAIEIDGDTHLYKKVYDEKRENDLKKLGITFLRFDGHYVIKNTNAVIKTIIDWIDDFQKTHP